MTVTDRFADWTLERLKDERARIDRVIDERRRLERAAAAAGLSSTELEALVMSAVALAAGASPGRHRRPRPCS